MSFDIETLYSLLPAVYRIRDIELAEQLDKLLTPAEQAELQSLRQQARLTAEEGQRLGALEAKRQRGPLKALLSVIAEQAAVLEDNLDQLYDDLFIETCAEWVVPYRARFRREHHPLSTPQGNSGGPGATGAGSNGLGRERSRIFSTARDHAVYESRSSRESLCCECERFEVARFHQHSV